MFGTQARIARGEPLGGARVQFAAPRFQQRFVSAVADQGVAEQPVGARRAQQLARDELAAIAGFVRHQVTQSLQRKALAEYRGRLEHLPHGDRQLVHARQHQRLDRARQGGQGRAAGIQQQLFEKQRIALGALDDFAQHRGIEAGKAGGQLDGTVRGERRQVERGDTTGDSTLLRHLAQAGARRVAVDTRRQQQQQRAIRRDAGQRRNAFQRRGIGPMHVFDQQQQRPAACRGAHQATDRGVGALFARGAGQRRVECAQLGPRRNVEQVAEEQLLFAFDPSGSEGRVQRPAAVFRAGVGRDTEQTAHQVAHGVAAAADAEVEHRRGMAGQPVALREFAELRDQAGLADPRIAAYQRHAALPLPAAGRDQRREAPQLIVAADDGLARHGVCSQLADDPIRCDPVLLALDLDGLTDRHGKLRTDFAPGVGADHHFVGGGQPEQACAGVHRIAGQGEMPVARIAAPRHDQPAVDAAVHGQRTSDPRLDFLTDGAHRSVQFACRAHRTHRIVAPRHRDTEQGNHLVADELVDDSAMAADDAGRRVLDAAHDEFDLLGIEPLIECGIAREVGKHDAGMAPLAVFRHEPGAPRTAVRTEFRAGRQLVAAVGACHAGNYARRAGAT